MNDASVTSPISLASSGSASNGPLPTPFYMLPEEIARRAFLPEVLLVEDVALVLGTGNSAAQRLVSSGECGPYSRVARRLTVRRESFLEALRKQEIDPLSSNRPPHPKAGYVDLLLRTLKRGKQHE